MSRIEGARRSGRPHIAYLTVLYPAISHTFIQREVVGLRSLGVDVTCFSLNGIDEDTLLTDLDRDEWARTIAIKTQGVRRLATTIGWSVLRHPGAVLGTIATAIRHGGLDVKGSVKRILQVGEALVLHDRCRRLGIRHIHVHFGQAPANVAWFATRFANLIDRSDRTRSESQRESESRWTFSITIHGPQDCLDEATAPLRAKIAASEAVVAVCDFTSAQLLRRIEPEFWNRVHVVRCGIEIGDEPTEPRPVDDPPTILIVARISPEKGLPVALEALAMLRHGGIEARLRLVGPGDYVPDLARQADELGVGDLVDHVGPLEPDAVTDEMRRATVYALPSFAEGLPIVLMEAMAAGLPVVASGIAGIPELVDDGVTGLLVPPARPDRLAAALKSLLTDADLRTEMAGAARRRVEELHDGDEQIERLARVLACTSALGPDDDGRLHDG